MTAAFVTQIELDDRGVAWIAGTKVKVAEVILDKIAYGSSPEEIHFQHPNLSMAQIHEEKQVIRSVIESIILRNTMKEAERRFSAAESGVFSTRVKA